MASLVNARTTLKRHGPCAVGGYRLTGRLHHWVCGVHLAGSWRLAYTTDAAAHSVTILFIGRKRERPHADLWTDFHALMGLENERENHEQWPCCNESLPALSPLPPGHHTDLERELFGYLRAEFAWFR